jgi:prepilin-type N-terminal cleavage/methylation domain-containing protein
MRQPTNRLNHRGFTIVELMVATAVFSMVLLVLTAGVLDFTHQYYKGITSNNTQNVARTIANQVAQDLQFSAGGYSAGPGYFCTANNVYSYTLGAEVGSGTDGLVVAPSGASCTPPGTPTNLLNSVTGARELLSPKMRLAALSITNPTGNLYTVSVKVIYGDNDLLTPVPDGHTDWATAGPSIQCSGTTGDDFCATSELTTTVDQRV